MLPRAKAAVDASRARRTARTDKEEEAPVRCVQCAVQRSADCALLSTLPFRHSTLPPALIGVCFGPRALPLVSVSP